MPRRILAPFAVFGALALAVGTALPASAAVDEQTWISPVHAAWSNATAWSSGEAPEAGDTLVFSGPGAAAMSDNDLGSFDLAGIRFETSHNISHSNGQLGIGTDGISVLAGTVNVNSDVRTIGAQTLLVASGASATFPGVITTDGVNELVLDVEAGATLYLSGNLDALATGAVSKTGPGTVFRSGGAGGGIGAGGLDVQEGLFNWSSRASAAPPSRSPAARSPGTETSTRSFSMAASLPRVPEEVQRWARSSQATRHSRAARTV